MAEMGDEFKVSINDILMKAVATRSRSIPKSTRTGSATRSATSTACTSAWPSRRDDGLIVPVIFDADQQAPERDLARRRASSRSARASESSSPRSTPARRSPSRNLGMFGIDQFTAIINPPEVGILAIGAARRSRSWSTASSWSRKRMRVTMSCDHRVVDGAVGREVPADAAPAVENPLMLVY